MLLVCHIIIMVFVAVDVLCCGRVLWSVVGSKLPSDVG